MFTVALIGPDGSGKTTVGRKLQECLPVQAKYMYMGVNHDASQHLLPTTRLIRKIRDLTGKKKYAGGPREKTSSMPKPPKSLLKRAVKSAKSSLSLANRLAEEWYRQVVAWYYLRKKWVVIFDRHFFIDYYAYDISSSSPRTLSQKVHGFILNRIYPRPDVIIFLDAPLEVLFARKGEGTLELLEERRSDYLRMKEHVRYFETIDANRSIDVVVSDVSSRISHYYQLWSQPR